MRKLPNTLYVTTEDAYLSLDGENVVALVDKMEKGRVPLHNLEGIVTFGYSGASPALMRACAERNVSLVFMSRSGRFIARVIGEVKGNVLLRKRQYQMSDEPQCMPIAKNIITGKIFNARWVIERATRDYPLRLDVEKLKTKSLYMNDMIQQASEAENLEILRGLEGNAAKEYFSVFDDLILQQKDDFVFEGRNKRPPLDNVNAMLSFVYT